MMPPRLKMTSGYAWLVPVACSGLLTSGVIGNFIYLFIYLFITIYGYKYKKKKA